MATLTISNEPFIFLPISIQEDAPKILHLRYQVKFRSEPLHQSPNEGPPPELEFISKGLSSIISRLSKPTTVSYKLVPASDPSKLVSYVMFNTPSPPDRRSAEQKEKELREEISKSGSGLDKELIFQLKTEDRELNLKYLGEEYEARYWELGELVTDELWQRRGLGTRLVEEGMREVERMVGDGVGAVDGEKVVGCYLVASPQGSRTYEKAGFVRLGGRAVKRDGLADEYMHLWFVKKFK